MYIYTYILVHPKQWDFVHINLSTEIRRISKASFLNLFDEQSNPAAFGIQEMLAPRNLHRYPK